MVEADTSKSVRLGVVIVLYNKDPWRIPSIDYLVDSPADIQVALVDNSTSGQESHGSFCESRGLTYLSMSGNSGISKAYNAAIETLRDKVEAILFLDDDTPISASFLEAAIGALKRVDDMIIVPIVESNGLTISPCQRTGFRYHAWSRNKPLGQQFSFINSGMVVRSEVFESVKFDERLFLDYVDHQFAHDVQLLGYSVHILNETVLEQEFAQFTNDICEDVHRFHIFCSDVTVFYRHRFLGLTYSIVLRLYHLYLIAAKHKSIRLFWMGSREALRIRF